MWMEVSDKFKQRQAEKLIHMAQTNRDLLL